MASLRVRVAGALLAALAALLPAAGASAAVTRPQGVAPPAPAPTSILINIPARTLYWFKDGDLVRTFPVGVGTTATQTPIGDFKVLNKAVDPWWQPPWGGAAVPPGPQNPLGTRWMGLGDGYGIHGTNVPSSIGFVVSHGCVRMYVPDVEWLYPQVPVGTPVRITYETAQMQTGSDGRRYLGIYPDVYGLGGETAARVLKAAGFEADAVTADAEGLYPLEGGALVNGEPLHAIIHQGALYLPARSLAWLVGTTLAWDRATSTISLDGQPLPTVLRGSTGYVDAEAAASMLGMAYAENNGTAVVTGSPTFLNGHLLDRQGMVLQRQNWLSLPVKLKYLEG